MVAQAQVWLAGQMPASAARLVSLHDPGARPIRKGRTGRPVEFGYKAQLTGNDGGIVVDYASRPVTLGTFPACAGDQPRRHADHALRSVTALWRVAGCS